MRKEDKNKIIDDLLERIGEYKHFYLTDIDSLNAKDTSDLRRLCFEKDIKLIVVKNTLLKKALERSGNSYEEIYPALKKSTSVMFTHTGNAPAKLIKEFRKTHAKPLLKGAYVEESVYLGEEQLDSLSSLKSRDELIGDIILLLQSPMNNVMSALKSSNNIITGVLKTLEEKK